MNDRIIAYCGLVCTGCPAYIATQADDQASLEQVAAQWREEFNAPDITVESVICDGCLTDDGRLIAVVVNCDVRNCSLDQEVANCAHCEEYACDTLDALFEKWRLRGYGYVADQAEATLAEVHQSLSQ